MPTAMALLGRSGSKGKKTDIWQLLTPQINLEKFLYGAYGPGLSCLMLIILLTGLFYKKAYEKILSLGCLVVLTVPFFADLLNGCLLYTSFEEEVLNAKKPVLVDFWATWCGPCQTMGPVVDELAQELTDVKVGKVNVDEQMALAREYKVMSIPTFLVFKDGKVAERTLGVQEKSELEQLIR